LAREKIGWLFRELENRHRKGDGGIFPPTNSFINPPNQNHLLPPHIPIPVLAHRKFVLGAVLPVSSPFDGLMMMMMMMLKKKMIEVANPKNRNP
jgi:hypothetical protein